MEITRSNLTFGDAIQALRTGEFISRQGWSSKGMYLWLLPAANVPAEWCKEPHLRHIADRNGGSVECLASIRMFTADKKVLTGWLASEADILATDWQVVVP